MVSLDEPAVGAREVWGMMGMVFRTMRRSGWTTCLILWAGLSLACSGETDGPAVQTTSGLDGGVVTGDAEVPSGSDVSLVDGTENDSGLLPDPQDLGGEPEPEDAALENDADGGLEPEPQDAGVEPDPEDAVSPDDVDGGVEPDPQDAGTEPDPVDAAPENDADGGVEPTPQDAGTEPVDVAPDPEPEPDPGSSNGCSDGTREGFLDLEAYPKIAACGGAWNLPGIHNVESACGKQAGNDGAIPDGVGCNVSDLCADGWHVCYGSVDVLTRNPLGCGGIMDGAQSPAFFVARTSSVGAFECSQDSTQFGGPGTSNDLFGCGDLGCPTTQGTCASTGKCDPLAPCETCDEGFCEDGTACNAGTCFPLTRGSHDLCKSIRNKSGCNCSFAGELDPGDSKYVEGDMSTVVCLPSSGGCGWCKPLNYWNKKLGVDHPDAWQCGSSTTQEANNVVKTDVSQGGVLCCSDEGFEPQPEPEPEEDDGASE